MMFRGASTGGGKSYPGWTGGSSALKQPIFCRINKSVENRAGKNLRFLKISFISLGFLRFIVFFRFLGFNVRTRRTVARGTLYTGIRSRRRSMHEDEL